MTFNGEVFNYRDFGSTLEAGHFELELAVDSLRARRGSDARVALAISGTMAGTMLEQAASNESMPAPARMLLSNETVRSKVAVLMRDFLDDGLA